MIINISADVNFEERYVVLYTKKKKGGHRTPRKIPMTNKLFEVLSYRYKHENRTTTEIYLHSVGEAEREAMSIYENPCEKGCKNSHTDSHTEKGKGLTLIG